MRRLFKIGFGLLITSIFPILSFLLLGITTGQPELSNIFAITYPCQFISVIIEHIFAIGANIKKEKEKNENAVHSGLVFGIVLGSIIFAIIIIFIEPYLNFMNVDSGFYKIYSIYAIAYIFLQMILCMIMDKLFFEEKEKLANIHTLVFGLLNFVVLIGLSLITTNSIIVISITLAVLFCYIIGLLIWQFKKFKLDFNILSNFKYESNEICTSLLMFCTYFFGLSNAFRMGQEYLIALNFVSLINDPLWDMLNAINTCAKIDIATDKYDFRHSLYNSAIFHIVIIITNIVLYFSLYHIYNVNVLIGLYFLLFQIFDFSLNIFSSTFKPYAQLVYSPTKTTIYSLIVYTIRVALAVLLPTAFCTDIAQVSCGVLIFVFLIYIRYSKFNINFDGKLELKEKKVKKKTAIQK